MAEAVVVGAGILGVCLADRLGRDGWQVTLVEQSVPGHARATSGGDTRVLRSLHADASGWYARSARAARSRWLELADELGEPVYHETGVAWLAQRRDGIEAAAEAGLRDLDIPCERLAPADAPLPGMRSDGLAFVLWEPQAGFLRARRAVQLLAAHVVRAHRVTARYGVAARPDGDGVVLDDGTRLQGDLVVWATGPWMPAHFPEVPVRVLRRDYVYLGAPGWTAPPAPPWIDYDAAIYGLGDLDGLGVKIASDFGDEIFDPQTGRRAHDEASEQRARAYLARRFPALAEAPLVGSRTCQYELTADTEFVVARLSERVWLLGGGSGHAFKHGPALADYVAGLVLSGGEPDPRFGLGPRTGGPSLITAGESTT